MVNSILRNVLLRSYIDAEPVLRQTDVYSAVRVPIWSVSRFFFLGCTPTLYPHVLSSKLSVRARIVSR